jgi:hypothetical protein
VYSCVQHTTVSSGQGRQLVQRGQHLRRRALEQAAAAAGKQGVAAEQQRAAFDVGV